MFSIRYADSSFFLLFPIYLLKQPTSWDMSRICCACEFCICSVTLAFCFPSVASFLMALPIVSSSLLLSRTQAARFFTLNYFLSHLLATELTEVVVVVQPAELELLGASAARVSGLFSKLPLFSAACVPACSMFVTCDDITGSQGQNNYVLMKTFV